MILNEYFTYIPEELDIEQLLKEHKPDKPLKADRLAFIVGQILYLPLVNDKVLKESGYVKLNASIIESKVGRYQRYMSWLIENEIIKCDYIAIKDEESFGYRLTDKYITKRLKRHVYRDLHLRRKLDADWKVNETHRKAFRYLHKWFNDKLRIDKEAAINLIEKVGLPQAHLNSIDAIHSANWRFKIDDTGNRLHTNLTNLKKDFRKLLRYDGEPLVEVDIKASQPYFFVKMIHEYLSAEIGAKNASKLLQIQSEKHGMTEKERFAFYNAFDIDLNDIAGYLTMLKVGLFYPSVQSDMKSYRGFGWETDGEVKEAFFQVAYSTDKWNSPAKASFKQSYPVVYSIMSHFKNGNYKNLAIRLQQIEAEGVLKHCCKRISKELPKAPIYTIHDSVLTTKEHQKAVREIMHEELTKFVGFPPILSLK